jgi:hypothetical protein
VFFGRNRGEFIMKATEKLVAAALSLTITLMGLALVTAPVMLAGSAPALTGAHTSRVVRPQPAGSGQVTARSHQPKAPTDRHAA